MKKYSDYRWPTKLKKFSITDPFLKILATKYEREIPWQVVVKDSDTLSLFVEAEMLPTFLRRADYPFLPNSKHFFVTPHHVNLISALQNQEGLNRDEMLKLQQTALEKGENEATKQLVDQINLKKVGAYKTWIRALKDNYANEPAFCFLVLRSLFELSGYGTRRALFDPSLEIIAWLHHRIKQERILPSDHLAKQYCLKLGETSAGNLLQNGWNFVPADKNRVKQLTAICRGSGWCIAGQALAEHYLQSSDFYILYYKGQPVVALRQEKGTREIVECQGRNNQNPAEWFEDIQFFVESRDLRLSHRKKEMNRALQRSDNIGKQTAIWWKKRIDLWPFSIIFAPKAIEDALMPIAQQKAINYINFFDFESLLELINLPPDLGLGEEDWCRQISTNPYLFDKRPKPYKKHLSIQSACIQGWVERIEDGEMAWSEVAMMPEFVKNSAQYRDALAENLPAELVKDIRKHRSTLAERQNPVFIDSQLPINEHEPEKLAIERMVNIILNIEDGLYTETRFPELIRKRDDFDKLLVRAWQSAIQTWSPLWFALPESIKKLKEFQLSENTPKRVDLDKWCTKVNEKPWLLTQEKGVPKTIRLHQRILRAYREGWQLLLVRTPWCVWVKRGLYGRVYMSHALLADNDVIDSLTAGWKSCFKKNEASWWNASERMRKTPALQVAILRAIISKCAPHLYGRPYNPDSLNLECWKICDEIYQSYTKYFNSELKKLAVLNEIETSLRSLGFIV
jgi:hypothetical protein